ncbi:MAG: preprotein translocase subunit SecY [Candidatus Diapherotrites archaeon]|nr:preprotein translocase subunit SecY [Candidatus Diapherotrites archaeon]
MSFLDALQKISGYLPEVKTPATKPNLTRKLIWSAIALVLFFALGNITLWGLEAHAGERLGQLQTILASDVGTLISAGIGPIVLASIILQLSVGSGIININLSDPKGRAQFQSIQKLLAVVLCFFEAGVYTFSGMLLPIPGLAWAVILQVAFGSLILLYLDEVVSKYGLGSGIGLFIAGGVSARFFWVLFSPPIPANPTGGLIATFIANLGFGPDFLLFLPVVIAVIIFAIIVFAEGMHVNIPITMGTRGTGGRFPVKLLYVSNIPVILAVALFANLHLWATITKDIPILGQIMGAVQWATTSQYNLFSDLIVAIGGNGFLPGLTLMGPVIVQAIAYIIVLILICIVFGVFWVNMGGQGPEAVAKQLQSSGMYIPGFRRDERIIQRVLERYIPTITILGSIFVALLAAFGDMTLGALASGTGILLTVGIIYRLYEELAKEQMVAAHPLLGRLFK